MRKTYQLNSESLGADLQFTYTEEGVLVGFVVVQDVALKADLIITILEYSIHLDNLKGYCKRQGRTLIEVNEALTFEAFWKRYNYKDGGSKKKTEETWNKMSRAKQTAAYNHIAKYEAFLVRTKVAKQYAKTYLNDEGWNND